MNTTATHNAERSMASASLPSQVKQHIIRFINENPEIFESLCRAGSPFGGNWYTSRSAAQPADSQTEMANLQRQLETLRTQVAQLTSQLADVQAGANAAEARSAGRSEKVIGINRFRALQASTPSMA